MSDFCIRPRNRHGGGNCYKNTGKTMEGRVMSMDIYFDANRAEKVTPEEDARIEEISRKYMEE